MSEPREAEEPLWTPAQRAVLAQLTELLGDRRPASDRAIDEAAGLLADALEDGVAVDILSDEGCWLTRTGAAHPQAGRRAVLRETVCRRLHADEGFSAAVLERGQAILIPRVSGPELRALEPQLAQVSEALAMRGFIAAPLSVRGRCAGILWQMRTRSRPQLGCADRDFLAAVAWHFGDRCDTSPDASSASR